jgi:outer membrane protein assembly factor BamD
MRAHHAFLPYILVALMASCSQIGKEPETPIESYSAKEIYDFGEESLNRNRPLEAAEYFGEIERLYPYSEWAKRGLVMQAFSSHKGLDYPNSRSAAQRYIDFYPASEDAAYAQYILALSYYDQIAEVGRDQAITFKALQELRILIERYPDNQYDAEAKLRFDLAFDYLATKEMEVGRYYLQKGHYTAAVNRFRVVVQDFRGSSQTPEALHRLVEGYLSLGLQAEAQSSGAVLAKQYGSSDWYEDSVLLLTKNGLSPDASNDNWLSQMYRQMIKGQWL